MLKLSLLAVVVLLALSQSFLWGGRNGAGHDFRGRCQLCHLAYPKNGNAGRFARDISYLCLECHNIGSNSSHPIGMTPSMQVPDGFSLDWSGRMTCATCHDPHDDSGNLSYLRTSARGRDFCDLCHGGTLPISGGLHIGAGGVAHSKTGVVETESSLSQVVDNVTLECLGCHDGVIASDASYVLGGGQAITYQRVGLSHPIGMDYSKSAMLDRELKPVEQLPPQIVLYDGKVGCASCHNPYSTQRRMLVVDNYGSALCLSCHIR